MTERIICFGDSITQGFNDDVKGGWSNRLMLHYMEQSLRNEDFHTAVFNCGISADTSSDLCVRLPVELKARLENRTGTVLFSIGINDSQFAVDTHENKVSLDSFRGNLEFCIQEALRHTESIILVGLTPVVDAKLHPMPWKPTHAYSNEHVARYDVVIEELATEYRLPYISMRDIFGETHDAYLPDGIHPNAEGHRLMFERIRSTLRWEN